MEKSSIEHEVEKLRQELAAVETPSVEPKHPLVLEDPGENRHDDSPAAPGLGELRATARGSLRTRPTVAVAFFALGFLTGHLITRRR
jgi:hypothetical protein